MLHGWNVRLKNRANEGQIATQPWSSLDCLGLLFVSLKDISRHPCWIGPRTAFCITQWPTRHSGKPHKQGARQLPSSTADPHLCQTCHRLELRGSIQSSWLTATDKISPPLNYPRPSIKVAITTSPGTEFHKLTVTVKHSASLLTPGIYKPIEQHRYQYRSFWHPTAQYSPFIHPLCFLFFNHLLTIRGYIL